MVRATPALIGLMDLLFTQENTVMAGSCPTVLGCPDGMLGRVPAVQNVHDNLMHMDSLTLSSCNTAFAFSLYKMLVLKNLDRNIVFSPFIISIALTFLALGAKSNTLEEILQGLKFNLTETFEADIHESFGQLLQQLSQPGEQVQISTGNTLFINKCLQILAELKEKARALYQAEAITADFQQPHETKNLINDYVRRQTQGKIQELISDLEKETCMVLVNYIYFKGVRGHA